ncbi:glycine cleavage system aminomethyltransferase GcvT [Prochlorococcus sp. MIT 1341]|uniref:glycine cleavage system aminomethyltransferase GcvT n=1 Tax=Prochlorococcus sp. MIT 1341 TaxID=3096221 RepID=UPI002A760E70|nr:glycine cleavage system aminomethyltransferase GcvT [Prochlorococcus sp. MIT 1341]
MKLNKTALFEDFSNAGARMVPFAGWEMPIQFSSLVNEHHAVRNHGGMFDISHMGIVRLQGVNAKDHLQKLVPTDLNRIGPGEACYTVLLNNSAGIIDDLIIYDLGVDKDDNENLLLVLNAACTDNDISWIKKHLEPANISIIDEKKTNLLIAIQGPLVQKNLERFTEQPLSTLPRFGHRYLNINLEGEPPNSTFIARTGYTGEDGFEILINANSGKKLWQELRKEGFTPCGLGARDTLRLEAGMLLYGKDMSNKTTPFEAGLGWLIHLEMSSDFVGRSALEQQAKEGLKKRLVGVELQSKAIARSGYPLLSNNNKIGHITSGSWSPTLEKAIGLGYVPIEFSKVDTYMDIEIRGQHFPAKVVKLPFYKRK